MAGNWSQLCATCKVLLYPYEETFFSYLILGISDLNLIEIMFRLSGQYVQNIVPLVTVVSSSLIITVLGYQIVLARFSWHSWLASQLFVILCSSESIVMFVVQYDRFPTMLVSWYSNLLTIDLQRNKWDFFMFLILEVSAMIITGLVTITSTYLLKLSTLTFLFELVFCCYLTHC